MTHTHPSRDDVVRTLADHSISPTRQRVEIGLCLFGSDRHVTAEQLLDEVNEMSSGVVSKATVYNTLGLFARKGLLREVVIDPTRLVFDTNVHPHHHTYNIETGQLCDLPQEAIRLMGLPDLGDDLEVEGVDVVVRVRSKSTVR